MEIYSQRTRSSVIVHPAEFTRGRIVWVAIDSSMRHERVCTGNGTEVVTQREFRERKLRQAAENRARYSGVPSRRRSDLSRHHSLVL